MEIIRKKTDNKQSTLHFPLLNAIVDPMLIKNNYGRILGVNDAALAFLNRSKENLINKTVFDLFPLEVADKVFHKNEDLLLSRKPINFEVEIKRQGISKCWLFKTSVLELNDGESIIVEIIQDQTKITTPSIGSNKNWFQMLFDTSALGIAIAKMDSIIIQSNETFSKMLGYSIEELKGMSYLDLTYEEDIDKNNQEVLQLKEGKKESAIFEKRYKSKSGKIIWAKVWVRRFIDNGETFFIATIEDLTNEKRVNHKLTEKNKELERYINSNAQLENFAYVASHDLKEPLRTIGNFTQLLERKYSGKFDKEAQECMDFIVDGVKRMNHLVEDLLAYSRITSVEKDIQAVSIPSLIELVQFYLRKRLEENEVSIQTFDLPSYIYANKTQMTQVFQNLISNAVKFGIPGMPVKIEIACQEDDHFWQFSVKDNGIGIKPEFHENIFVLFRKLHTREKYEGTGIGLSLCQKIVEQHGGSIWVESKENGGATFFFTISKKSKVC